jgi:hypothetical protein
MELPRCVLVLGDWLAFPSLLPASVASALLVAAAAAMGVPADPAAVALAGVGTLVVYNVDRLRDTAADHASAPLRTAFVEEHRRGLWLLTGLASVAAVPLALAVARDVQLLCAGVLAIGLLHRRLKRRQAWKPVYVAGAWVAVTVGIPALSALNPEPVAWVFGVYSATIGANLVATNLRSQVSPGSLLWAARALAATGLLLAGLAPQPTAALAPIPGCELLALAAYQSGERYGLTILDGALLAGALVTLAWAAIP